MVYITKSNADRMVNFTDITIDTVEELYPKKLYMFSKKELNCLIRYKTLMENPRGFAAAYDSESVIKQGGNFIGKVSNTPAYHKDINCERLHNSFSRYVIPEEIQKQGVQKSKEFAKWFEENEGLLKEDSAKFYTLLKEKYGITKLEKAEYKNTGAVEFLDLSINEMETEINKQIQTINVFVHKPDVKTIVYAYNKYYYNFKEGYVVPEITTNHTNEEIVEVMLLYKNYKTTLSTLLRNYFRAKFNPDLRFDESILKQLGYRPCPHCCTTE